MWKLILVVVAVLGILLTALVSFVAINMFKPELVHTDLRREFATTGLAIGQSTKADMLARFGPPERERTEYGGVLYEYPSKGLLFRMGGEAGTLYWYEYTGRGYATARGIKVGDTFETIKAAYGPTSDVTPLQAGLRVRYNFGTAFTLEFRLNKEGKLARVVFFKS